MRAYLPRTPRLGYDAPMSDKPGMKGCLRAVGWVFSGLGLVLLYLALTAIIERFRFGAGLLFADVEILSGLTLFFGGIGGWLLWYTRPPKEPEECREGFLEPPSDAGAPSGGTDAGAGAPSDDA